MNESTNEEFRWGEQFINRKRRRFCMIVDQVCKIIHSPVHCGIFEVDFEQSGKGQEGKVEKY